MRQGLHDMEENEIYRPLPSKMVAPKQENTQITPASYNPSNQDH